VAYGRSRFDFLLRRGAEQFVLEVKSCTLFGREIAMFPDAVTDRGRRHLMELAELKKQGIRAGVLFIVHWPHARYFMPEYHTDLAFSRTLLELRNEILIKAVAVSWKQDLTMGRKVRELEVPWPLIEQEAYDRGSYLLILHLKKAREIRVGSLGWIFFKKGYYIYVGSAMDSLTRRIERHKRLRKKLFWHVDYLREEAEFVTALPVRTSEQLECEIAGAVNGISEWMVPGFGSSDCSCETHLFGMKDDPLKSQDFVSLLIWFRIDRLALSLQKR
jgi:sugar fermentation stimulation protein A